MNSIGEQFLARSAFANKQDRQVRRRNLANDTLQIPDSRTQAGNPVRVFLAHFSMRRLNRHKVL